MGTVGEPHAHFPLEPPLWAEGHHGLYPDFQEATGQFQQDTDEKQRTKVHVEELDVNSPQCLKHGGGGGVPRSES